ncbi:MAG: N-acetylmuramoyl-L-alanine amidase [Saprospiraceae bacterium]|nr:N-acetylmuramoyl-L-alanine amidase [Lewinella sp.]
MSRFSLSFLLLLHLSVAFTQSRRAVLPIISQAGQARWASSIQAVPLDDPTPFLAYFLKWEGDVDELMIRFSPDGEQWSDWQLMPRDEHSPELPVSTLGITAATDRFFQVKGNAGTGNSYRLECHFYSPGPSDATREQPVTAGQGRSCDDLMPAVIRRTEWCPNGDCAEHPDPAFAPVTHLVIHHSAGTNVASDWAAIVRAIWDLHVNGNGWSDIGYNWLIDPDGRIYEGRSNDAIGAHFCAKNTGTIGVCVMGDFTNEPPKGAAVESLVDLLSWKACSYDIDPLGETYHASSAEILPNIIGHRDGCSTACPGDMFYPLLPAVRDAVATGPPTAVRQKEQRIELKVFPNPSHGTFQLELSEDFPQECYLNIYDLLGRRISGPLKLQNGSAETQLVQLPKDLSSGNYRLVLRDQNRIIGIKGLKVF